jgi:hypothetical protein
MTITLTTDQHDALERTTESPPRVLDPTTGTTYVLVRADSYARQNGLLDDDTSDTAALVNEIMQEDDADDPLLAGYQNYPDRS